MPNISRLTLTNFRNYASLAVEIDSQMVVLTGENGAGKTNLLEAVSLLAPGRGLRRATYADIMRSAGDGGFTVHATIDSPAGDVAIGTGFDAADMLTGPGTRKVGSTVRPPEALTKCWNG